LEKTKVKNAEFEAALQVANAEIAKLENKIVRLTGVVETQGAALKAAYARIAELEAETETLKGALDEANTEIAALKIERDQLTRQVETLTAELEKCKVKIDELTIALNHANAKIAKLICEGDQLAKERSEFFVRLREALGDRDDVRIVGDRFIFPSAVLFAVGSAALNDAGREQIVAVARVVGELELQGKIPVSINWVLQVNGHTDTQPIIGGSEFDSNWELSTARALSVVELLREKGVSPVHLAAAGFGEYQPLEVGNTPEILAGNRRIELKLTDDGPHPADSGSPLGPVQGDQCQPVS